MNNVVKTASIITSGIIVGALIRKVVQQGMSLKKQANISDSIKKAKNIFEKEAIREDVNEFFI
jgi:uncharacterized membrane-anchored protein YhcB (DUF1043 family)